MFSDPLVSVIIPCYNYGRYLSEALDSLLAQTYANWECIIVDDGSTDNTREVAGGYTQKDSRFKYFHQSNSGVSGARNRALQEANGTYIQLLDADDLLEKEKFRLQVAFLEEHPDVDLVYSIMVFFRDGDKTRLSAPRLIHNKNPVSGRGEPLLNSLIDDNLFLPSCSLARRSLYDDVGLFQKGIEGIEDWHYFYRAALLYKVFYYDGRDGTKLVVRAHGTNASGNQYKMWSHTIKARELLIQETLKHLGNNNSKFSGRYLLKVMQLQKALLYQEKARLSLLYGNILKGGVHALQHGWYSRKPYFAIYDAAHWIKERLKAKKS